MAHLVVLVLDCVDCCPDVLQAWENAGSPGATVLESTGPGRLRGKEMRDDLPLVPSLLDLLGTGERHHRTLFAVIDDDETVERVIEETERIVGDFSEPHSGLLFVVPVSRVIGLKKHYPKTKE
jgi:nitrogen regulatory protein P-II 1